MLNVEIRSWCGHLDMKKLKSLDLEISYDDPPAFELYSPGRAYLMGQITFDDFKFLIQEYDILTLERNGSTIIYLDDKGSKCRLDRYGK